LLDSKDFNNSYEGLLDLLIIDFGVRIVFLDIRVVESARARGRKIILFGKKINEGNKARISRFSAFFCSFYKFCGPFSVSFAANFFIFAFSRSAFSLT
jgi:hypothetical protein